MKQAFLVAARSALLGALLGAPVVAAAPQAASAAAKAEIIRPIAVTPVAELSFGKLIYTGNGPDGSVVLPAPAPVTRIATRVSLQNGGGENALIRALTGEPNRIYRVSVPSAATTTTGGLTIRGFTLWTATRGDISATRLGAFDAKGADTLRLGGTLIVPKGTKLGIYAAKVPLTISYE